MNRKFFIVIAALFCLLSCAVTISLISNPRSARAEAAPASSAASPTPPTPDNIADEIIAAISAQLQRSAARLPVAEIFATSIEDVRISADSNWAQALLVPQSPTTDELLPSEPGLALAHWDGEQWLVLLPGDTGWLEALQLAPDDLISPERKATWTEIYLTAQTATPDAPLTGYLLPWAGGVTRYLSQSIFHDIYTPSGSAHYAFDFYTSGKMWDIYAAKSGTVWLWRDDVPTCLESTCSETQDNGNYIVLKDPSTSPVSYQLYLHLAQDSIPANLKAAGTPVIQGQLIGVADNTGQSWGHHLHFQVHTNPASYWGYSVDILFTDVSINEGRPRTPAEAAAHPEYGAVGQSAYMSSNFIQDDPTPPTGGLLDPLTNGFEVLDGKLTVSAWALDTGSGVARAQVHAFYQDTWHAIGLPFTEAIHEFEWDLCAAGVPIGPVSLYISVEDYANNMTPPVNSLRHGLNNTDCSPPPPACVPNSNQIALFSEPDFGGACQLFSAGDYPNGQTLGLIGTGNAAAIKVGSGVGATLYSAAGYSDRRETFFGSDAGFSDNLIGPDELAAMRVFPRTQSPGTPALKYPAGSSAFTLNETISLFWQDQGGSDRYDVELSSGSDIVQTASAAVPYWQVPELPPGEYSWRVRAVNSLGMLSAWSPKVNFAITDVLTATTSYTAPYTATFDGPAVDPGWVWTASWVLSADNEHVRTPPNAFVLEGLSAGSPASGSLTSPEIIIPQDGMSLSFYYRFQAEKFSQHWDQRWVLISVDGGPYEQLVHLGDDEPGIWLQSPVINLSAYVGHRVRFRFYFDSLDELENENLTWEIDDFRVESTPKITCPVGEEPDDAPGQAVSLVTGVPVAGVICPAGDEDYFRFDVEAPGTQILFDVDAWTNASSLDAYLFLLDQDGQSVLAEVDDEIPYQRPDPRLGYIFSRPGTYFLKVKAWDHPQSGSEAFFYSLTARAAPLVWLDAPVSSAHLRTDEVLLQVLAQDNGGVTSQVRFAWHDDQWESGSWQLLGTDQDGSDGWSITLDVSALRDQHAMAFYAVATDRTGREFAVAAWNVSLESGRTIYLPIIGR